MRITYTSIDGKTFNTENECKEHEKVLRNELLMYTYDGQLTEDPEEAWFVHIKSEQARNIFQDIVENSNYSFPDVVGRWFYEPDSCTWLSYDELMRKCPFK